MSHPHAPTGGGGYPVFEPPKLIVTDVFDFQADPNLMDLSTETIKTLASPGKRTALVISQLEAQASTIIHVKNLIQEQLTRLQVEAQYISNMLKSAPEVDMQDDVQKPSVFKTSVSSIPEQYPPQILSSTQNHISGIYLDDHLALDDDETKIDEDLPPLLQQARRSAFSTDIMNGDDLDSEEEDMAHEEIRRILGSQYER